MTEPRRPDDNNTGGPVTTDVQQHRGHAATIGNSRAALNDEGYRARAARTDGRQSKTAIGKLLEQLTAPPMIGGDGAIASRGPENALYVQRSHGAPPEPHWGQVIAYLRAVAQGEDADEVLEDMHARRRDALHVQPSIAVEQDLYREADAIESQPQAREAQPAARPALPSAALPAPTPEPLPHREPIAPPLPPLFPPAPEPTPAETTSHLVERVIESRRDNGQPVVAAEAAAAARLAKRPAAAPDMGPAPDPGFVASALPGRIGDTVTMRTDEVLAHLDAADASGGQQARVVPPFATAASAAESPRSVADARAARGDDDAES